MYGGFLPAGRRASGSRAAAARRGLLRCGLPLRHGAVAVRQRYALSAAGRDALDGRTLPSQSDADGRRDRLAGTAARRVVRRRERIGGARRGGGLQGRLRLPVSHDRQL